MSSSEPVAEWTSSLPQETNDSGRASHGPHDPTPRTVNEIPSSRVENGTGKSRPDRLRLPFKPTVNRFREKNGKTKRENGRERERELLGCFPDHFHGSRFQPGKFPREFPYLL